MRLRNRLHIGLQHISLFLFFLLKEKRHLYQKKKKKKKKEKREIKKKKKETKGKRKGQFTQEKNSTQENTVAHNNFHKD